MSVERNLPLVRERRQAALQGDAAQIAAVRGKTPEEIQG